MNSRVWLFTGVYLIGVLIAAISQILLKKSAGVQCEKWYQEYLNLRVICAYFILFCSTICTVIAYKDLPLSMGPILGALEYLFVPVLGRVLLKEQFNKKKVLGLVVIIIGVILYSL